MKNKGTRFGTTSKVAVAAAVMAMPMLAHAQKPKSDASPSDRSEYTVKQKTSSRQIKMKSKYVVAGSDGKHEIYKNSAGQYFWLDPKTGDQKFVSKNVVIKNTPRSQ
jgi:hypothetical protein